MSSLTTLPLFLHLLTWIFPTYFTAMSSTPALVLLSPAFPFRFILTPDSCVVDSHVVPLSAIITFFIWVVLGHQKISNSFLFPLSCTCIQLHIFIYVVIINVGSLLFLYFQPSGVLIAVGTTFQKYLFMWNLITH